LPYEVPQKFFLNAEAQMMMGQIFNGMKTGKYFNFRHKKSSKELFAI
jgi:hypothetical protein